jgi:hypothetical protein
LLFELNFVSNVDNVGILISGTCFTGTAEDIGISAEGAGISW